MRVPVIAIALFASLQCAAQTSAPDAAVPSPAAGRASLAAAAQARSATDREVRRTVIEDESTRIEELHVRGVPQRIVVTSKGARGGTYEIITGDGSRDLSDGANTSRGAAGRRVWNVLNF